MTTQPHTLLKIKDVAEQTGVAAATIRMWEQRHGFPTPSRTPAGYRLYTAADVEAIRAVLALRHRGLSVAEAIDRARDTLDAERGRTAAAALDREIDPHPSIYAAVSSTDPTAHPRVLRRPTLIALSRAIEDELLSRGTGGLVFGAFQREMFYDRVRYRYEQIAPRSEATVVFADFPEVVREPGEPVRVPIEAADALGNEWAVVVDSPGYCACLLAWERPAAPGGGERRFESLLSLDPRAARRACEVGAALAGRRDPALGEELRSRLAGRPLPAESPTATLTSLTNRMVAYLDERVA